MTTTSAITTVPSHALAAVLGPFCSGKEISTFLTVAQCNYHLRQSSLPLCRGILVERYIELASQLATQEPEIKDVLNVVREDIRLSQDTDDNDDEILGKFSKWCAILDYFELQWRLGLRHKNVPTQWIVWSGDLEIPYGVVESLLVTSNWTVDAMSYWRNRELASTLTMTHPRNSTLVAITLPLYGRLLGRTHEGRRRLQFQNRDLSFHAEVDNGDDLLLARNALVPMDEMYEEDPFIAIAGQPRQRMLTGLKCFWDSEEGEEGDWEDAVAALGEHAIRVLTTTSAAGDQSLESLLGDVYRDLERG